MGSSITVRHLVAGTLGAALLRNWYRDGDVNEQRRRELVDVLSGDPDDLLDVVLDPTERDLLSGYAQWSEHYDGHNPLIAVEEQVTIPILDRLVHADVRALDAGCGTGRNAALLAERGAEVIGFDQSAEMLAIAQAKVPSGRFDLAEFAALPYPDEHIDVIVSSLAVCHLPDPTIALGEFRRVIRPGGTVVVADPHPDARALGGQAFFGFRLGEPLPWVRNHFHPASTWLRACRDVGFGVVDCVEVPYREVQHASHPAFGRYPDAVRAATGDLHGLWVWTFRRD